MSEIVADNSHERKCSYLLKELLWQVAPSRCGIASMITLHLPRELRIDEGQASRYVSLTSNPGVRKLWPTVRCQTLF